MDEYTLTHSPTVDPESDGTCVYQGRAVVVSSEEPHPTPGPNDQPWVSTNSLICYSKDDRATLMMSGEGGLPQTMLMKCADKHKTQDVTMGESCL